MADNVFDEMRRAVIVAQDTLRAADLVANDMAWLLQDRLRSVDNVYTLTRLKRELRDFDMNKKEWKA